MAIRITCPGCKTGLTFDDDKRGQAVRCDNCNKGLKIPAASGARRETETEVSAKAKTKSAPVVPPEWDGDEEPKKRKKKKEKQSGPGLVLGLVGGGIALFLVLLGGGAYWVMNHRKDPPPRAPEGPELVAAKQVEKEPVRTPQRIIVPPREEGNPDGPTKKGGKGVANSVRGAGYRLERKNELKQISISFVQYFDDYKGANRNMNTWLDFIKTYGPIHEAVKDGYYKMNFNARPESSSVVAYERDMDNGEKYLCAFFGGNVDYVPLAQLKEMLGRDP